MDHKFLTKPERELDKLGLLRVRDVELRLNSETKLCALKKVRSWSERLWGLGPKCNYLGNYDLQVAQFADVGLFKLLCRVQKIDAEAYMIDVKYPKKDYWQGAIFAVLKTKDGRKIEVIFIP